MNPAPAGTAPSHYTVQDGETLFSIAQAVWGDSSLWYLIADANGLAGAETLPTGSSLIIPDNVATSRHSAATFRPYDPNSALGDLSPTDQAVCSRHRG